MTSYLSSDIEVKLFVNGTEVLYRHGDKNLIQGNVRIKNQGQCRKIVLGDMHKDSQTTGGLVRNSFPGKQMSELDLTNNTNLCCTKTEARQIEDEIIISAANRELALWNELIPMDEVFIDAGKARQFSQATHVHTVAAYLDPSPAKGGDSITHSNFPNAGCVVRFDGPFSKKIMGLDNNITHSTFFASDYHTDYNSEDRDSALAHCNASFEYLEAGTRGNTFIAPENTFSTVKKIKGSPFAMSNAVKKGQAGAGGSSNNMRQSVMGKELGDTMQVIHYFIYYHLARYGLKRVRSWETLSFNMVDDSVIVINCTTQSGSNIQLYDPKEHPSMIMTSNDNMVVSMCIDLGLPVCRADASIKQFLLYKPPTSDEDRHNQKMKLSLRSLEWSIGEILTLKSKKDLWQSPTFASRNLIFSMGDEELVLPPSMGKKSEERWGIFWKQTSRRPGVLTAGDWSQGFSKFLENLVRAMREEIDILKGLEQYTVAKWATLKDKIITATFSKRYFTGFRWNSKPIQTDVYLDNQNNPKANPETMTGYRYVFDLELLKRFGEGELKSLLEPGTLKDFSTVFTKTTLYESDIDDRPAKKRRIRFGRVSEPLRVVTAINNNVARTKLPKNLTQIKPRKKNTQIMQKPPGVVVRNAGTKKRHKPGKTSLKLVKGGIKPKKMKKNQRANYTLNLRKYFTLKFNPIVLTRKQFIELYNVSDSLQAMVLVLGEYKLVSKRMVWNSKFPDIDVIRASFKEFKLHRQNNISSILPRNNLWKDNQHVLYFMGFLETFIFYLREYDIDPFNRTVVGINKQNTKALQKLANKYGRLRLKKYLSKIGDKIPTLKTKSERLFSLL